MVTALGMLAGILKSGLVTSTRLLIQVHNGTERSGTKQNERKTNEHAGKTERQIRTQLLFLILGFLGQHVVKNDNKTFARSV